ncbi:MAG: hypothetical protein CL916_03530, partial [Deltaproteobacteria bacterium]|nr:hypothetical protein [Deltaproteobacteria bacterium]
MLLFYLFSSLYAQPCPAGLNTKISLLEKETVPKKVWTTQQKIPESAHIIIESTDKLPSFTTIRSTTSLSQDGYLIELNNSFVQVFRKGPYKDIPITKRVPISQKKQSSIHIMQNEASMELWVCRKEKTLAHIRWEDTAFSDGFVHIEHPSSLKHTQVSYLPESTIMQAMWPQDILHSSALLQVEGEDLPPILEQGLISNPLEPGLWSLLADRYSIATILPYKKNIVSISKSIPYWAINNKQHIPPIKQEEELIRLVQKYDVELHQIGTSRQGRAIWAMQVAPSNKKKPSVLFMGGISGNDVHSTQNTFEQLYHLLETQDGLIELWKEKLD